MGIWAKTAASILSVRPKKLKTAMLLARAQISRRGRLSMRFAFTSPRQSMVVLCGVTEVTIEAWDIQGGGLKWGSERVGCPCGGRLRGGAERLRCR
jgi:hypothetical protein